MTRSRIKGSVGSNALLLIISGIGLFVWSNLSQQKIESAVEDGNRQVQVTVSIPPIAYLVERIGRSHVSVSTIVNPGASPHTYEPTPKQIAALDNMEIYFAIGEPFETRLLEKITPSRGHVDIVHLDREQLRSRHDDPHLWLTPVWGIKAVELITEELVLHDSAHAEQFREEGTKLRDELSQLDVAIGNMLLPFVGRRVYVYHDAFGYFCDRYHLKQVAIEEHGKEPGARWLADVVKEAKADRVSIIFAQPQHPLKTVETIANEVGARAALLDPLAFNYIGNLQYMAEQIAASLTHDHQN